MAQLSRFWDTRMGGEGKTAHVLSNVINVESVTMLFFYQFPLWICVFFTKAPRASSAAVLENIGGRDGIRS
jgi:hypothetical protein